MTQDDLPVLFRPAVGKRGITALHFAAYRGDHIELERQLASGANPNTKDQYRGYAALHWLTDMAATGGDRLEMLRRLVSSGADVNLKSENGETPLSLARAAGSAGGDELATELLRFGARE